MSQLTIRNDLFTGAVNVLTPLVGDNIAFENKDFDPEDLTAWCSLHFVPATSDSMGKGVLSSDDERGFMQVSIYVKSNSKDYDNEQLAIIDELKTAFYNGAIMGNTVIQEVTTNNGYTVESWFKKDMTINYTSYVKRG